MHFINPNGEELVQGESAVEEVTPTECGSGIGPEVNASNPQAKPGNLCVYATELQNTRLAGGSSESIRAEGTAGAGALFQFTGDPEGNTVQYAGGTWAVTAE
jgi:hypothetical protein